MIGSFYFSDFPPTVCVRILYRASENEIENGGHRTKICKNRYDRSCPFGHFCWFVADWKSFWKPFLHFFVSIFIMFSHSFKYCFIFQVLLHLRWTTFRSEIILEKSNPKNYPSKTVSYKIISKLPLRRRRIGSTRNSSTSVLNNVASILLTFFRSTLSNSTKWNWLSSTQLELRSTPVAICRANFNLWIWIFYGP